MSRRRQKIQYIQLELASPAENRGESRKPAVEGTELPVAKCEPESPASTDQLMEGVCQRDNLVRAFLFPPTR